MAYSRDDAVNIARDFLQHAVRRHKIRRAFLFGSSVWGQPAAYSDIDLALVLDASRTPDSLGFGEAFEIFHEAQEYNSALEVVCFTVEEFQDDSAGLIRRIKKEGLEISPTTEPREL